MDKDLGRNDVTPNESTSELGDDTMAKVAGGDIHYPSDGMVFRPEDIKFVYSVGDRVEVWQSIFGNTKRATIINCHIREDWDRHSIAPALAYYPVYNVGYDDGGGNTEVFQNYISR